MRGTIATLFALLSLAGLAEPARGDFLTETVSSPQGGTATDFSLSLMLPTFNGGLGTLEGVTLSFADSEVMHGTIQNGSMTTENFEVIESSLFFLAYNGQSLISDQLSEQQSFAAMQSGETQNFGAFTASGSSPMMTYTSGMIFDAFSAPAPAVAFNYSSLTSSTVVGGGGNGSTEIHTEVAATLTATFEYAPATFSVPGPSSVITALVGLGLVGFAQFVRRTPANQRIRAETR